METKHWAVQSSDMPNWAISEELRDSSKPLTCCAAIPAAPCPTNSSPRDLKALYRLMNRPEVTHESLLASLRAYTFQNIAVHKGTVLLLHDATERREPFGDRKLVQISQPSFATSIRLSAILRETAVFRP
jgi:hypothetical protein